MSYKKKPKPEKTGQYCPVCGMTITEYSAFMGKCLRGHLLTAKQIIENGNIPTVRPNNPGISRGDNQDENVQCR